MSVKSRQHVNAIHLIWNSCQVKKSQELQPKMFAVPIPHLFDEFLLPQFSLLQCLPVFLLRVAQLPGLNLHFLLQLRDLTKICGTVSFYPQICVKTYDIWTQICVKIRFNTSSCKEEDICLYQQISVIPTGTPVRKHLDFRQQFIRMIQENGSDHLLLKSCCDKLSFSDHDQNYRAVWSFVAHFVDHCSIKRCIKDILLRYDCWYLMVSNQFIVYLESHYLVQAMVVCLHYTLVRDLYRESGRVPTDMKRQHLIIPTKNSKYFRFL